jgi:hypothetical protein
MLAAIKNVTTNYLVIIREKQKHIEIFLSYWIKKINNKIGKASIGFTFQA